MKARDVATARSRAYALLAEVYRHGITDALRPTLAAVPDLAEALPEPFDVDAAAAMHYRVFGRDVFPYASVFLDDAGRLGGSVTDAALHMYLQAGWAIAPQGEAADHIGQELAFLGFLVGAEADALEDGLPAEAMRMRLRARQFLDEHLLSWLPAFVRAVQQLDVPFFGAAAALTLEVVLDHRAALGQPAEPFRPVLPQPPALLDDERTGLKDIAAYLMTTAWSGLYLGQADLARIGRAEQVPRGFSTRVQTLSNLLHAAVEFDRAEAVLGHLHDLTASWNAYYRDLGAAHPFLRGIAEVWRARLGTTERIIARIREAAVSIETE